MTTIIGTLPVTLQNGTTADASQVMSDLNFIVNQVNANAVAAGYISPGSLLNIQVFTSSGTYTPTSGATRAVVEGVACGGAGGGTVGTSGSQTAAGSGGSSGAYGKISITGGLTSQAVAMGTGGTGTAGGAGGSGGNVQFGSLMILGGGAGGNAGAAISSFPGVSGIANQTGGTVTGSGNFILQVPGQSGKSGFAVAIGQAIPGEGGCTPLGFGGQGTVASGTNFFLGNPTGYGAGGAGFTSSNNAGAQAGYSGANGIIVVYEFA